MDPLHNIVHALTANEKRYFRMFAKAFKSDTQVLRLFSALDKLDIYDEAALKNKTGINKLVPVKISLRKMLFKAMRNYRQGADVYQDLRDDISNIEFLIRKDLKDEAAKEIRKALKQAEKSEAYQYLTELQLYRAAATKEALNTAEIHKAFQNIHTGMKQARKFQEEVQDALLYHYYLVYYLGNANYAELPQVKKDTRFFKSTMGGMYKKAGSNLAKIGLLTAIASIHADRKNSLKNYALIHRLYKQDAYSADKYPHLYFVFLTNYATRIARAPEFAKTSLELFAETETAFKRFENYFIHYPDKFNSWSLRFMANRMWYALNNNDWRGIDEVIGRIKPLVENKRLRNETVSAVSVVALIACLFTLNRYEEALEWVRHYYVMPSAKIIKPTAFVVRFYEVVCFYAIGDFHLSDVKAGNLVKSMAGKQLTDEYYKQCAAVLRRLNNWDVKKPRHRQELNKLINNFIRLREREDDSYGFFQSFFKPEKILEQLFVSRQKG